MGNYLCSWCGEEFDRKGREHFCSEECRRAAELNRKRESSRAYYWKDKNRGYRDGMYECTCLHCGKSFWAKDYRERLCSDECRKARKAYIKAMSLGRQTKVPRKNGKSLTDMAVEARKRGISYGKLMAMKEGMQ